MCPGWPTVNTATVDTASVNTAAVDSASVPFPALDAQEEAPSLSSATVVEAADSATEQEARLAAVRDCGLVDLHLAAKLMPPALELKPCLMKAFDAMMCNLTPSQFANQTGVKLDTAWNYYRQVAESLLQRC